MLLEGSPGPSDGRVSGEDCLGDARVGTRSPLGIRLLRRRRAAVLSGRCTYRRTSLATGLLAESPCEESGGWRGSEAGTRTRAGRSDRWNPAAVRLPGAVAVLGAELTLATRGDRCRRP
jgi:hypothetical protein